jgi:hypothetical protein
LNVEDLYPNKALAELLEEEKCCVDEPMHPSIRKWRLEAPPTTPVAVDPELGGGESTSSQFLTTPMELERRQRLRRHAESNVIVIVILLLFVIFMFAFLPGGLWLIIVAVITAICCLAMPQH